MRTLFTLIAVLAVSTVASACPFCTSLRATFSERREQASCVVFGELGSRLGGTQTFRIHRSGAANAEDSGLVIRLDKFAPGVENMLQSTKEGRLVILIAEQEIGGEPKHDVEEEVHDKRFYLKDCTWDCMVVDELAYAYFAGAPTVRQPIEERLKYFAGYLEHANSLVAADAYYEFGAASYDAVYEATQHVPEEKLRAWLADPNVPPERHGLYALMLGIHVAEGRSAEGKEVLETLITRPSSDFRAGYDGMLGGYLVATGLSGLEFIEQRLLKNPDAAVGDLRHAANALRFYHDYEQTIPRERVAQSVALFLSRPEMASAAIVDLARWQYWDALPEVLGLVKRQEDVDRQTMRSAIGYLIVCPKAEAKAALDELRATDPAMVADVESQLGVLREAQ